VQSPSGGGVRTLFPLKDPCISPEGARTFPEWNEQTAAVRSLQRLQRATCPRCGPVDVSGPSRRVHKRHDVPHKSGISEMDYTFAT